MNLLELDLKLGILPDSFAVSVEYNRYGTHGNRNECQQ